MQVSMLNRAFKEVLHVRRILFVAFVFAGVHYWSHAEALAAAPNDSASSATTPLARSADAAIGSARGYEGAKTLSRWQKSNSNLLQSASSADCSAEIAKVNAQLDKLLDESLIPRIAEIDKFGSGIVAVDAGTTWYRNLISTYDFALRRLPVCAALDQFFARRNTDLAAAKDDLIQRIQTCEKTADLDAALGSAFALPSTPRDPSLAAALNIAGDQRRKELNQRRRELNLETTLAMYAPEERAATDARGHIDPAKFAAAVPSADGVRLAILRGFAAGSGRLRDSNTALYTDRTSPLIAIPMAVNITNLKLDPPVAAGKDEFICTYRASVFIALQHPGGLADLGFQQGLDASNASLKQLELQPKSVAIVRTADGWAAPDVAQHGLGHSIVDAGMNAGR